MGRLVLWDVDHTLVESRGVGSELSAAAFEQVTGVPLREQAAIDGLTERVIFRRTAKLHGLATTSDDFESFAHALTEQHMSNAHRLRERGAALPGAAEALDALHYAGLRQTVVTGNVKRAAEIKLQVFRLDTHISWEVGAYGDDAEVRSQLVELALSRAEASPSETVLLGDTPADVEGGHTAHVRVIGIASGRSSSSDLRSAGAEAVLPDLTDTQRLVRLVSELTALDAEA